MKTKTPTVARIRPISWKVCVADEDCVKYVRNALSESGLDCSEPIAEPELQDPPMFSFVANLKADTPLTAPELQAILEQDSKIEVAFEA